MKLSDTISMMTSEDYKERFKAEYYQLNERYERLKALNTKIEAAEQARCVCNYDIEEPKHDCPRFVLEEQERIMSQYLHVLEVRAVIEGIEL